MKNQLEHLLVIQLQDINERVKNTDDTIFIIEIISSILTPAVAGVVEI